MIYKVKAKIDKLKMREFYTALTDGSIASMEPDGPDIVNAMQQARMMGHDILEWYETCECDTPLKNGREGVYIQYLSQIETHVVESIQDDLKGKSFWDCLEEKHFSDFDFDID